MHSAPFTYVRATSLEEATRFLAEHAHEENDTKILAGGQSLIPLLKLRFAAPAYLLDIARLETLREIHDRTNAIEIGSLATHAQIESSPLLRDACPLLAETAAEIGDVQVRHRGTIGGSLAHADPSGDLPAAALALNAQLTLASVRGERVVAARDFFVELMTTALEPDEIITSIRIPKLPKSSGSAYVKFRQQASGFAIAGVASIVELDEAGKIVNPRVAVTGIGAVPYRAAMVEKKLAGMSHERFGRLDSSEFSELATFSGLETRDMDVLSDLHAGERYRRHLAGVYTRRSLSQAIARALGHALQHARTRNE